MNKLPVNWFDIFLLVWLTMGIFRGRKRGMSEELLTFLQWLFTVGVCAFTYHPLGDLLASKIDGLGRLGSFVAGYLLAAGLVALIFLGLKRGLHGKLIGSDTFGKAEYYLGMPAGMVRFLCMLLAGLALLNARLYTREEIAASKKFAVDNFGKEYFPGLQAIQVSVFEQSLVGPPLKKYLNFLLIMPTKSEGPQKFKQKEWSPVL